MLRTWTFLLTTCLFAYSTIAVDITENRVDRGPFDLSLGDVRIHSGHTWSIINNAISAFIGELEVEKNAGLYITSTSPVIGLDVTMTPLHKSINNKGIIAFNSVISLTRSLYDLVGYSFTNDGEMYLGASGYLQGSVMSLTAEYWTNNGLLVFYQNQRTSGSIKLGRSLGSITNNGQICLYNQVFIQNTDIVGKGCITAQKDSTIYIPSAAQSTDERHNIYLVDRESSIIVQALSTPQTFNVYGFGNGNTIGLTVPLVGVPFLHDRYEYEESTGILTIRSSLLTQKFNIGKGYDSKRFTVVTDEGQGLPSTLLGSVQYNGPVPSREIPDVCRAECKSLPEAPGTKPTRHLTTFTITTNNVISTVTGYVDVTTDSKGSWYTTTTVVTPPTTSPETVSVTEATKPTSSNAGAHQPESSSTLIVQAPLSTEQSPPLSSNAEATHVDFVAESSAVYNPSLIDKSTVESGTKSSAEQPPIPSSEESQQTESSSDEKTHLLSEQPSASPSVATDAQFIAEPSAAYGLPFVDGPIDESSAELNLDKSSLPPATSISLVSAVETIIESTPFDAKSSFYDEIDSMADSSSYALPQTTDLESIAPESIAIESLLVDSALDAAESSREPAIGQSDVSSLVESFIASLSIASPIESYWSNYDSSSVPEKSSLSARESGAGAIETESGAAAALESEQGYPVSQSKTAPLVDTTSATSMYLVEPIESSWINYQSSLAGPSLVSYESYVSEANSQSQILPIDESSLAATEYTTSWEVVNSDGSVTTQSGMVNQSGDSLTTFTTFPPQQAEQGISSTAYTTTFTTTNSEGKIITATGLVVIATDENKSWYSTTSILPTASQGQHGESKSKSTASHTGTKSTASAIKSSITDVEESQGTGATSSRFIPTTIKTHAIYGPLTSGEPEVTEIGNFANILTTTLIEWVISLILLLM